MRRVLTWVVVAAVGVFAVVGLWSAARDPAPASVADRSREIAQSLRCPTCAGESIADSAALLSEAMRQTVEQQVREGRSADEIRSWFAERYGREVLLDPPPQGQAWLLWAVPLALVGAGAVVLVRRPGRRRRLGVGLAGVAVVLTAGVWLAVGQDQRAGGSVAEQTDRPLDAVAVLRDAVTHAPGDVGLRVALADALEQSGDLTQAVAEYAAVTRLQPLDPDIRYRHAFALVRDGDPQAAVELLEETLTFRAEHPPTLLLLGALVREAEPERSVELLARFAELEPDHPAADQVTDLLAGEAEAREVAP